VVEAEDEEEAERIAKEKWKNKTLTLNADTGRLPWFDAVPLEHTASPCEFYSEENDGKDI